MLWKCWAWEPSPLYESIREFTLMKFALFADRLLICEISSSP